MADPFSDRISIFGSDYYLERGTCAKNRKLIETGQLFLQFVD